LIFSKVPNDYNDIDVKKNKNVDVADTKTKNMMKK